MKYMRWAAAVALCSDNPGAMTLTSARLKIIPMSTSAAIEIVARLTTELSVMRASSGFPCST